MKHFKGILIMALLAMRMLYGVEIHSVSSVLADCAEMQNISGRKTHQCAVDAPHSKKKIRISASSQDKKEKHKTPALLKSLSEKFTDEALSLPHSKSTAYFKLNTAFADASKNSLYRLHFF
ncbi:hypothetical protein [Flavobacterium hibernum]|uniref:Secreted protein n=2 Tax=Flavobacterium hibernum TaxID=37752 RepID=A0ABX4BZF7_9FLAO|nr:hypothetical protein [Flavobacterium hibernum]OXA84707.1 hypothetical protein B0A73_19035 [Flavobacterium hibernum]